MREHRKEGVSAMSTPLQRGAIDSIATCFVLFVVLFVLFVLFVVIVVW